jgi:hypothetical protein
VSNGVPPGDRRAFIAERRRVSVHRFDTLHSPDYDENWGAISPSHAAFVTRLITLIQPGGDVLDAACGTGKYWPAVLAAGLKPQAPAYVTVEVPDGPLPAPVDPRQVPGEHFEGGGYHYYPARDQARDWLAAAGFGIEDEQEADCYWHFLLQRR